MKNEIVCPLCGRKNYTLYLTKPNHRIVRCDRDGLLFVNPQPDRNEMFSMYNEDYFDSVKKRTATAVGYYDYLGEKPLLLPYFRRKIAFLKTLLPGKKVLEVGSSYGFFLEEAKRAHLDSTGIDISRAAVAYAKSLGLPSRAVDLFQAKFPSNSFDCVVAFHLIEHIADPLSFMQEVRRIIKPGGIILLATPWDGGPLQRVMGKTWFSYRHEEHTYFFSFETMALLLKKAGYRGIHCFRDEIRWYPIHYFLRGATYLVDNRWLQKTFGLAERLFRLAPFSYLQVPYLDTMIVTAEK